MIVKYIKQGKYTIIDRDLSGGQLLKNQPCSSTDKYFGNELWCGARGGGVNRCGDRGQDGRGMFILFLVKYK